MKRRILSIITALALCLSLCPTWAFAEETEPDTGLCVHHPYHTDECGYIAPSEGQPCGYEHTDECYTIADDGGEVLDCQHTHDSECGYVQADPGQPCGYECPLCPIEALIAALPRWVTEDNAETVRWQLDEILDLWWELDEEEQGQLDLSLCRELQEQLDEASIPAPIDEPTEGDGTAENPWQCGDNVTATLEGGTLTIRGTGKMSDFNPSPWDGEKENIKKVVIESGVTSIGKRAFSSHKALQSVEIPTGVTEIGFNAFFYCTALQSVTIPGSVKTIGESAFSCSGLTEVTIPEGVTFIDFYAFQQCSNLTKVAIPASVTEIGQQAFYYCRQLTEVTFAGQTAPKLGNEAFHNPSGGFPGSTLAIIVPTGAVGYTAENGWPIVAQVETDNAATCYGDFNAAWTAANSGTEATITLLADVTASGTLTVDAGSTITLKGGDYTLTSGEQTAIQVDGTLKLESGTVKSTSSSNATGINVSGTLEMTGGAVTASNSYVSGSMAVHTNSNSNITISGGKISGIYGIVNGGTVTIQKGEISGRNAALDINSGTVTIEGGTFTSSDYGLNVETGSTVFLCGGTFTGGNYAINSKNDVSDLLDKTRPSTYYAYFLEGQPVNLNTLADAKSLPGGIYAVQECKYDTNVCEYQHIDSTEKHTLTCLACGYTEAAVNCSYEFSGDVGTCTCGDKLTVRVDPAPLTYDGTEKKPGVTVKRGDAELATSAYTVSYANHKDAGDATVRVSIGTNQGTYSTTFEISPATPTIAWAADAQTQTQTYTGNPAIITAPTVTLVNGEIFSGTIMQPIPLY